MRRTGAALVVFALLINTFQISANAAVKAGATCTQAGLTSKASGKTFTCIKSGRKLVWNKRVPVKPTPSRSPEGDAIVENIRAALKALIPVVNTNSVDDSLIGELVVEDGINPKNVEATKILMRKLYVAQPIMKLVRPPVLILGHSEAVVKSEFARRCSQDISWVGVGVYTMSRYINWALA